MLRRAALFLITALMVCSITASANANGRFPQAQAIVVQPGSDAVVYMRTTFGLLVSRDAGRSWHWLCERAFGYQGQWDPPIAVTRDGRLWVGLENGLASTADGCEVQVAGEFAGETVKDLTTDPRGDTLWALTGAPGKKSHVWRLAPGKGWVKLGEGMDDFNAMTLEVAPSRPGRLYVSGQPYGTIRGRLYRSDDGGTTLQGAANDLAAEGPFFIAAVDPKNPDRVVLRHLHTKGSDVLVTADAGRTFRNVLSMKSAMYGFAKSPDGATLWAGSGLDADGLFVSTNRGETFERVASHGVLCLDAIDAKSLFACENVFTFGAPAVATSVDQGKTWTSLARFSEVRGPASCPVDAGAALCADAWPETLAFVSPRRTEDAGPVVDAGRPLAPAPAARRSCGCDVVGFGGQDRGEITAGLATLIAWARARARRGSRRGHPGSRLARDVRPHP